MNKPVVELIAIDQIEPNPLNKELFAMTDIEHLANIIKEEGFTTPIEVYKKANGKYEISSGHRRYEACKLLKYKEVQCYVLSSFKNENDKNRKLISSNIASRKLSPLEMANAIKLYKEILKSEKFKGNTREKVAEYFGISESNVYRYECLLKLIPELQEFCKKPQFPYSSLRQAASLSKAEQKELYEELLRTEASKLQNLSDPDDIIDEVDKDEIIFSRTRVEQIINSKIKKINANQSSKEKSSIKETVVNIETQANNDKEEYDISEFIASEEAMPELNLDDLMSSVVEDTSFLKGFDSCIDTIKAYKKNANTLSNKAAVKDKLDELKEAIKKLEAVLD